MKSLRLDSIDEHIINTEVNITSGNVQLQKARTYQVIFTDRSKRKPFQLIN